MTSDAPKAYARAPASQTGVPTVAIDAGHGGSQAGARGICNIWEKDVTLAIAHKVSQVLVASGRVRPMLTRTGDDTLALPARSERALAAGASLFVSIHANASVNAQARGVETFFLSLQPSEKRLRRLVARENEGAHVLPVAARDPLAHILGTMALDAAHVESQALAMNMQEAMVTKLHSRGRGVLQAPFMVLAQARMPAVLVEVGFLTHPQECAKLVSADGQEAVAQAIATGILTHVAKGRSRGFYRPRPDA